MRKGITTMKNMYRVEMMNEVDWGEYMRGGFNYNVYTTYILAETAEHALTIAIEANPGMVINTKSIKTTDEIEAEEKAKQARIAAEEEKAAAAKAKRLATEMAKAEAEGMTLEEYRAKKAYERKVKAAEKAVAEAEEALAKAKARLAELMK
jgi:hypothetical protein